MSNTLIRPADVIIPLLNAGYFPSVTFPGVADPQTPNPGNPLGFAGLTNPNAQGVGFVVALGGRVVELVNGLDPVVSFSQIDGNRNYIFQLKTRVATKISDMKSIVRLEFN